MTSSGRVVGRHLLLPAPGFLARPYSSLLPYRIASRLVVVGAMPGRDERNGPSLSELRDKEASGMSFTLGLAPPLGSWTKVATLTLGARLRDRDLEQLRFDPSNTGGGIELAGLVNRLRRPAYRGSQEGRLGRSSIVAAEQPASRTSFRSLDLGEPTARGSSPSSRGSQENIDEVEAQ